MNENAHKFKTINSVFVWERPAVYAAIAATATLIVKLTVNLRLSKVVAVNVIV